MAMTYCPIWRIPLEVPCCSYVDDVYWKKRAEVDAALRLTRVSNE
jgi:hypothetical protein